MKPHHACRLAACAMLAMAGGSAQAQTAASASAEVVGLSYYLVDLDPTDAIDPSVTFFSPGTEGGLYGMFLRTMYSKTMEPDQTGSGAMLFRSGFATLRNASGTQWASRAGGNFGTSVRASVADLTQPAVLTTNPSPWSRHTLHYYGDSSISTSLTLPGGNYNKVEWTLSPKTQLVIDGTAVLHTSSDIALLAGTDAAQLVVAPTDTLSLSGYAYVTAELAVYDGNFRRDEARKIARAESRLGIDPGLSSELAPRDLTEAFQISMSNTAGTALTGEFRLGVDSSISMLHSQAVPEPGTWMLMGLGLLGVAGLARHRRAR